MTVLVDTLGILWYNKNISTIKELHMYIVKNSSGEIIAVCSDRRDAEAMATPEKPGQEPHTIVEWNHKLEVDKSEE